MSYEEAALVPLSGTTSSALAETHLRNGPPNSCFVTYEECVTFAFKTVRSAAVVNHT